MVNMRRILFLCSGNYYRSRIAEELFNHLARSAQREWRAESRGLNPSMRDSGNPGPMAEVAIRMLTGDRIQVIHGERYPLSVTEQDFLEADLIVAMSKAEHEPMILKDWFKLSDRVHYWDVEDLHLEGPETAYEKVKHHVRRLFNSVVNE